MIYADNASTTKISDVAFEKMLPYLQEQYGNASSQHSLGAESKRAVEHARRQVAGAIGATASEILFTSGGSEGNSWVLQSVCALFNEPIHLITSSIEHHSVLNACHAIERQGVSVTYLPVSKTGYVSVSDVKSALRPETKLVSVMLANNEIGTIQPVSEIANLLIGMDILFHTDAVQAVGHIPVAVRNLQVDFLTASAHKFNGAKGTGFLYKKSGLHLPSMICGGRQEWGLRGGTENVAGIVAAGYAIEESVKEMPATSKRLIAMAKATVAGIKKQVPSLRINSDIKNGLPGNINIGFDGLSGESFMNLLNLKGICVSTHSACNSGSVEPSHVLLALGQSEQQAKSAIRISYGKYNNTNEVTDVVAAICGAFEKVVGAYSTN